MDRAERRSQQARVRAKMRRYIASWNHHGKSDPEWVERTAAKMANHGKLCSCYMCGNPRRHFDEPTIQERRAQQ